MAATHAFSQGQAPLAELRVVGRPEKAAFSIATVQDVNGRLCAAVQVVSYMNGFSYQSNNGVVRVDDNPGEDMVYLSPDERALKIMHSTYAPLQIILSEYGIQLREKEVWVIKIAGEKQTTRIAIGIVSTPAGAEVFIDGTSQGTGERHVVSIGSHKIRLVKTGYQPVQDTIRVDQQNTLFRYSLKEQEDVNTQITSVPEGASVYLDEVQFGNTHLSKFYPSGRYKVRVTKEWYVTYEDSLDLIPPVTRKTFSLQPDFGSLTVASSPETGLDITLNGVSQQAVTPHTFDRLKPGIYEARGRSEYFETAPERIEIGRNDKKTVMLATTANFAVLNINTRIGATVYINGERISSLRNIRLAPSYVTVRVEMAKATPVERRILLKRGDNQTVDLFPEVPSGTIQVAVVPFDAGVQLKGDAGELIVPDAAGQFKDIPAGTYTLSVRAEGFSETQEIIVLKAGEKLMRNIELKRQSTTIQPPPRIPISDYSASRSTAFSRGAAFMKSVLVPGLGQITSGTRRGWIYTVLAAGGAVYYATKLKAHNSNLSAYKSLNSHYQSAPFLISESEVQNAYNKSNTSYKSTQSIGYAVIGIYAINLLDALLFNPVKEKYSGNFETGLEFSDISSYRQVFGFRIEVTL